jgi:hypothetical protein
LPYSVIVLFNAATARRSNRSLTPSPAGDCGNTTMAGKLASCALTTGPSPTVVCATLSLPFSPEPWRKRMTGTDIVEAAL